MPARAWRGWGSVHRIRSVALVGAAVFLTAGFPPAVAEVLFPTRDEALARASVVIRSGATADQYRVGSPPSDTTYDLRGLTSKLDHLASLGAVPIARHEYLAKLADALSESGPRAHTARLVPIDRAPDYRS